MKAYKASYNGKCETLTYEVGKTYTFNGEIKMCEGGFHFCKELKNVFNYYPSSDDLIVFEIEVLGNIIDYNDKSVTNKLKIIRIIPLEEYQQYLPIIKYDSNNNLIHYKDSNGNEEWKEYDSNNNLIHYKDSNGNEEWRKYDSNNNMIYRKTSNVYEEWYEYNKNNKLTYYKSSRGDESILKYNEQDSLIYKKITSNMGKIFEWSITIE